MKFGKKYYSKDFESSIGKWKGNRFLSQEVVEEIDQDEFEKGIKGELDWYYFEAKCVTC